MCSESSSGRMDGCERSPSVRCAASHPVDGWMDVRGRRQLDVQRVIQWTDGCERSPSVRCAASHPVDGWM